jgi:hypothetical protein
MTQYEHRYFSLHPDRKEVKDENGKLLRVTGNPYRLLELLCQRHPTSITITDINLAFDPAGAREYTEAHVRAMKNLVHTAIGRDVIKYRNRVYSIIGALRQVPNAGAEGKLGNFKTTIDTRRVSRQMAFLLTRINGKVRFARILMSQIGNTKPCDIKWIT